MTSFVTNIKNMLCQLHDVSEVAFIETHISWVFLTGQLVYKVKKPINLGFVDFSSLDKRRRFCFEELRLNKRLAPNLYLDVVAITTDQSTNQSTDQSTDQNTGQSRLQINGAGTVIEYAVRLHQFDEHSRFDQLLKTGKLTMNHIESVAAILSRFHKAILPAPHTVTHGAPATINYASSENFRHCLALLNDPLIIEQVTQLRQWSDTELLRIQHFLLTRQQNGFVRECHGDVHLANIALHHNKVTVFDCIEFNPDFRWIDVINEVAFLVMDLLFHARQDYATRLLNVYLAETGDYAGLAALRYYLVYRAMVRAKVEIIRAHQKDISAEDKQSAVTSLNQHINLARQLCNWKQPYLIIMHGLSGSGKSSIAKKLQEKLFVIQLRSDVERKRLFLLNASANSHSSTGAGIYTAQASKQTYARLQSLAETIIKAGLNVLVDATFLHQADRQDFMQLAIKHNVRFAILDCCANTKELKHRITTRAQQTGTVSEATLDVLEQQLRSNEPLTTAENEFTISIDTLLPVNSDKLVQAITALEHPTIEARTS